MNRAIKALLRVTLIFVIAGAVLGFVYRDELQRLWAVNSLFAEDRIVANFSNMRGAFLATDMDRGSGPVTPLPAGPPFTLTPDMHDWLDARAATSLVILKDGKLVYESYHLGTRAQDLRISWSVAKSYLSALLGIVLDEGSIASLDDPVTQYAPALVGSAYEAASIRNVLQMSSGVVFDEDYFDYDSDINKMGRVLALGGSMDEFAASIKHTFVAPGTDWTYVSIDTHILSMVLRGATGRSIADLMKDKLIVPMGLEATPYYLTDGFGVAFVLGGLNVTSRDYARMGLMYAQGGQLQNNQIVPADWVAASVLPSAPTDADQYGYGYQWWAAKDARDGEFFAQGVYGQYIYVDARAGVVIVRTAADKAFRETGIGDSNIAMFRRITEALSKE